MFIPNLSIEDRLQYLETENLDCVDANDKRVDEIKQLKDKIK